MRPKLQRVGYLPLVYTTQVNSTSARADWLARRWLAKLEVLFTSEQPAKNKMAFVGILSQIKLLFGPLVIQLVWYILNNYSPKWRWIVVDIYLAAARATKPPPPIFFFKKNLLVSLISSAKKLSRLIKSLRFYRRLNTQFLCSRPRKVGSGSGY